MRTRKDENDISVGKSVKRGIANLLGLMLAFGIAAGGLFAVQSRLAKERKLLWESGGKVTVAAETEIADAAGTGSEEAERAKLTEEELLQAMSWMQAGAELFPHEPFSGQMSMEEAVECGRTWLTEFLMPHLKDGEFEPQDLKADCFLWTRQAGDDRDPLFSNWTVTLSCRELSASLILNAVSGQVLEASVNCNFPIEYGQAGSMRELLADFARSFGLKDEGDYLIAGGGDGSFGIAGQSMYMSIGSGRAAAAVQTASLALSTVNEDGTEIYTADIYNIELILQFLNN